MMDDEELLKRARSVAVVWEQLSDDLEDFVVDHVDTEFAAVRDFYRFSVWNCLAYVLNLAIVVVVPSLYAYIIME